MIKLLIQSLKNFTKNFKSYIVFEILTLLATSFIFVPLITYIYKITLKWMGSISLLNNEIYNITRDYKGIIGIILTIILCEIVFFIEIGVLVVITQKIYFNKSINTVDAILVVLKKLPKLFGFSIVQIIPVLLFLFILINPLIYRLVSERINIFIFINTKLQGFEAIFIVFGGVFFVYVFLRSIFTIHFIVLKDENIRKAIISSVKLTKYNKIKILINLVIFNVIIILTGFLFVFSLSQLLKLATGSINNLQIKSYLMTILSYISYLLIILITPVNVIFVTNLFYRLLSKHEDIQDDLVVRKHLIITKIERKMLRFFKRRRLLSLFVIMSYLTVTFLLNYSFVEQIFNWDIVVASHRGYYSAPENSISGIRTAIEKGIDAVEIDVQMTLDGILVLNHDDTLKRVAGINKKVSDMTYAEIKEVSIGAKTTYQDEKIPSLEEALEEIRGKIKVIIDIKTSETDKRVAQSLANLIEAKSLLDDVYVQSFSQDILDEVRLINPDIKIGRILFAAIGNLEQLDVDFYTIHQFMLSYSFVRNAHRIDREVWVWTVNQDNNIREVLKYRVNGIISRYPERVKEIMSQ